MVLYCHTSPQTRTIHSLHSENSSYVVPPTTFLLGWETTPAAGSRTHTTVVYEAEHTPQAVSYIPHRRSPLPKPRSVEREALPISRRAFMEGSHASDTHTHHFPPAISQCHSGLSVMIVTLNISFTLVLDHRYSISRYSLRVGKAIACCWSSSLESNSSSIPYECTARV